MKEFNVTMIATMGIVGLLAAAVTSAWLQAPIATCLFAIMGLATIWFVEDLEEKEEA